MSAVLQKCILPPKVIVFFLTFATLLSVFQGLIALIISSRAVHATDIQCTASSFVSWGGESVVMKIACGESQSVVRDSKFIAQYLNEQRPFRCTLYEGSSAKCQFVQ